MFWEADPTPQQSKKDKGAHVESDHTDLDMWEESLSDRRVTVHMSGGRAQVHPSDAP